MKSGREEWKEREEMRERDGEGVNDGSGSGEGRKKRKGERWKGTVKRRERKMEGEKMKVNGVN